MKAFDRYSLLCFSIALIITLTVFIDTDEPEDKDMIGVVYDVKQAQAGYTFFMDSTGGDTIKCFFRTEPLEYGIYSLKGTFSDDGSILFVNSMRTALHNEF